PGCRPSPIAGSASEKPGHRSAHAACPRARYGPDGQTSTQVNTPLKNPHLLRADEVTEMEVTDPTHPLFGRRFPVLSARPQPLPPTHLFVTYQGFMVLRIPRPATNLHSPLPRVSPTLTSHPITELISLAEQCEVLCRTSPEPSGSPSAPHSKPPSAPSLRP